MRFKNNTRQLKKSIQGLRSFKDSLPKNIKKTIIKRAHIYSQIIDNWKHIAGNDIFKVCFPKSFKNLSSSGINRLNIMVKKGHELDVEYSRNVIVDRINTFLGYEFVNNIKIIPFEDKNEKFKKNKNKEMIKNKFIHKISSIENDKIKNSLLELGKLIKKEK
tara:strand:- start:8 stop:493 length:486 start_codon:yes stop_codon:yes gene_type:complete